MLVGVVALGGAAGLVAAGVFVAGVAAGGVVLTGAVGVALVTGASGVGVLWTVGGSTGAVGLPRLVQKYQAPTPAIRSAAGTP